jgi:manganese efflux pump family protein
MSEFALNDIIIILPIALGLSADCFAVAISASISAGRHSSWRMLRTALAFGSFQAVMPLLGWLAGRTFVDIISGYDHWIAFGLLAFVGGKMLWESFDRKEEKSKNTDITRGFLLLTAAVATSIDALAVGLSFAFMDVNILLASLTIGIIAFIVTLAGFPLGRKVSKVAGKWAETVGGVVLIGIGLRILITHLVGA